MFKKVLATTLVILLTLSCVYFAFPDRIVREARDAVTVGTIEAAGVADATCDGVADNTEALAMLTALPGTGGRISFLTGTYAWANLANVTRAIDNVTIDGTGRGTYIDSDGVTAPFTAGGNNWTISNMRFDAPGPNMGATTGWCWENVTVGATYYAYRTDNATTGASWNIPSGRGATLVVAASDASATEIAQADYFCDGVADQAEVNAAITALPAFGGIVKLTSGGFHTTDSILINKCVFLRGNGVDSTWIYPTHAANPCIVIQNPVNEPFYEVSDVRIHGNGAGAAAGIQLNANCQDTELGRMWISNMGGTGIDINSGWDINLHNVVAENNVGIGLDASGGGNGYITDCNMSANLQGIVLGYGNGWVKWSITGGQVATNAQHNIVVNSSRWVSITGVVIYDAGGKTPTLNTYDDILLTTDGAHPIGSISIANIPIIGEGAVAGSTRYGINIDRNGTSLATSKISIEGVNFTTCATSNIKLDTTLNLANVRIRNVNGDWAIFDDSSVGLGKLSLPTNYGWTTSHVNGNGYLLPMKAEVSTSVVASSRGMLYCEADGWTRAVNNPYYQMDWSKSLHFGFDYVRYLSDVQVVSRVQLKEANTEGVLGAKGIGIQVDNDVLYGESYGTGLAKTSLNTAMDLINLPGYAVDVFLIPGTNRVLIFAVNNVVQYIETDTTKIPTGVAGGVSYLVHSIINGVGGGTNCHAYICHPWISQTR